MDGNHRGKYSVYSAEPDSLVALTSENESTNSQRVFSLQQQPLMHMDIDGGSQVFPSKVRGCQCNFLKACCGSTFILVAAVLVGFCISIVSFKLARWSAWHGQDEQRSRHHHHFVESASCSSAAQHLKELTKAPHVAGSLEDMATADYVKDSFKSYGLKTSFRDYEVLLSFPLERSVTLLFPNGSEISLRLAEDPSRGKLNETYAKAMAPFHAYGPSGNATAEVVYANYGRLEDYDRLKDMDVNVSGKIIIARYGKVFRGDVVSFAANAGARAVILYSDPEDFAGGGKGGFFPDSKWLPPTGVQRGTVFQGAGDPLTPGWPSTPNGERLSNVDLASLLPQIPSLPISANDALFIMSSLGGAVAPPEWHGALEIPEYRVGTGPIKLHLNYEETKNLTRIRNVFGVLEGAEEPDRYVMLGNHRDAWTFGAVDPNSGTAALLEIARRFGILKQNGWQPRRTLLLCSWDAEEYGMIGSTEWVEQNTELLAVKAVAYFNVDCAVAGPGFFAAATPQLDMLIKEVTKKVQDPDIQEKSVYDTWAASAKGQSMVTRLGGGGSDFTAFLQHVGVPSMDIFFGEDYPVYHSLYDTFEWLEKFGDPSFKRLAAASTIWGLAGLRMADNLIIPVNYKNYADELEVYTKAVEGRIISEGPHVNVTIDPIFSAIKSFREATVRVEAEIEGLQKAKADLESCRQLGLSARMLNDRLLQTERAFLESHGLPEAVWHKHLVYGPSKGDAYGVSYFPGINWAISNAVRKGEWDSVQHEVWRVARAIERATLVLIGQLA